MISLERFGNHQGNPQDGFQNPLDHGSGRSSTDGRNPGFLIYCYNAKNVT